MDISDLQQLLTDGESETLATFEKEQQDEILKTACAMANTTGGWIIVGVTERMSPISAERRFKIDGILTHMSYRQFFDGISNCLSPSVAVEIEAVTATEDRKVILISVDAYVGSGDVTIDGIAYRRNGKTNLQISSAENDEQIPVETSATPPEIEGASTVSAANKLDWPITKFFSQVTAELLSLGGFERVRDVVVKNDSELLQSSANLDKDALWKLKKELDAHGLQLEMNANALGPVSPSDETSAPYVEAGYVASDYFENDQSDEEKIRAIAAAISEDKSEIIELGSISEATGLPLDFVEGHSELFVRERLITEISNTSSGPYIVVRKADRIMLDRWLKENPSPANLEIKESSASNDEESAVIDRPPDTSIDSRQKDYFVGGRSDFRRNSNDDEICLNANEYAIALAAFFENAGDDLCFGMFGHWGRGKTYLMDKVSSLLKSRRYSTVRFSAWKYRSTPETWAYLFNQFYDAGQKEDWRLPYSSAFVRNGVLPLLGGLFALDFSLYMSHAMGDMIWLLRTFGVASIIFIIFTALKFFKFGTRVHAKYIFKGHQEQLGLQATIGRDLAALVKAWVPLRVSINWKSLGMWIKLTLYIVFSAFALRMLWYCLQPPASLGPATGISSIDDFRQPVNPWAVLAIYVPCFTLFIVGPFILFWPWWKFRTDRILLIIDDLDRCESAQMLEIIESTMLLLDNEDIKKRVQIAMLVEERAVRSALAKKYRHLWFDLSTEEQKTLKEQILRENIEKIFLAHLRLPELSESELREVILKFLGTEKEVVEVPETRSASVVAKTELPPSTSTDRIQDHVDRENQKKKEQERVTRIEKELTWSADESKFFASIAHRLNESSYEGRWGPRAIRCLLTRYQMARSILLSLGVNPDPDKLAEAVLSLSSSEELSVDATPIDYVAKQVS